MKHLVLVFIFLILTSAATAQTQTDFKTLLTTSGTKVITVEGATEIDISTAKGMLDRGVKFVDVRGKRWWKEGHIPGASSLKYATEGTLLEIVDKNQEVVFYCDCDVGSATCNLSPTSSARAVTWGFQNVYYFTNSHEWEPAGYPIEKAE